MAAVPHARTVAPELLDGAQLDPNDLRVNLREMAMLNRLPGGVADSVRLTLELIVGLADPSVLDVGTGSGDYVRRLVRARPVRVVASDVRPEILAVAEARALHHALGEYAAAVPVSGTKGLYGHPLGASGAIEAAIMVMALDHGLLPGTCNLESLDPRVELNVLREPLAIRPSAALSTSFGFGGLNAALVFRPGPPTE